MMDGATLLGATRTELANARELDGSVEFETIEGRTYGDAPAFGLTFVFDDLGRVNTVHLHADGHEGCIGYRGSMPAGIEFGMRRSDVRALLGEPDRCGDARSITRPRVEVTWDRFDLIEVRLHVEYSAPDDAVHLVTLTRPSEGNTVHQRST